MEIENPEEFARAFENLRGKMSYDDLADYLNSDEVSHGRSQFDKDGLWRLSGGWFRNRSGRHNVLRSIDTTIYLVVGLMLHGCAVGMSVSDVVENGAVLLRNVGGEPLIEDLLADVHSSRAHVRDVSTLQEYLRELLARWLP